MDKIPKDLIEALEDLNTPDKISCISAVMTGMGTDHILDFIEGLKQSVRKIFDDEICRAKQIQDQYEKSAIGAKELQNKLLNAKDRL